MLDFTDVPLLSQEMKMVNACLKTTKQCQFKSLHLHFRKWYKYYVITCMTTLLLSLSLWINLLTSFLTLTVVVSLLILPGCLPIYHDIAVIQYFCQIHQIKYRDWQGHEKITYSKLIHTMFQYGLVLDCCRIYPHFMFNIMEFYFYVDKW